MVGSARPQYLVRDRDRVYGEAFTRRIRAMGIRDRPTAPRSPWENGYAERLIGFDPTRMPRSCDRVRRAPSASRAALLRALLQWRPNTLVASQGLAPTPSRPGGREHSSAADPRRTAPSLCPDMICDRFPRHAAASEPHQHDGAELIYVLRGKLSIVVEEEETILSPGDAMYFDSGAAHTYRQHGKSASSAIVIIAPSCVYRKLKLGHTADEVRRGWDAIAMHRSAELDARWARLCPGICVCELRYSSSHRRVAPHADAPRQRR
jgi:mannose-6-phosphate isomerase-like protein (cupin superfamily)